MKKPKGRNIVEEIYRSMGRGTVWYGKYGMDLSANGKEIEVDKTSGNLDFGIKTYQSRMENVYLYAFLFDYETKKEYDLGYFYFKANQGLINREMMEYAAEIIERGSRITEEIFEMR